MTRFVAALLLAILPAARAQEPVHLRDGLAIARVSSGGRQPFMTDPVALALVRGEWRAPAAGDAVQTGPDTQVAWQAVQAGEDGWFRGRDLAGGYLLVALERPEPGAMILSAQGDSMVYVNGEPRAGDPYSNGLLRVPVMLQAGRNELLFAIARGQLRAELLPPEAPVAFDGVDYTLPDQIEGEDAEQWAGVPLLNSTADDARDIVIRAVGLQTDGAETSLETAVRAIPRLSVYKAPVRLPRGAADAEGNVPIRLEVVRAGEVLHTREIKLRLRGPHDKHVRTFLSGIDSSVQYFAVTPPPTPAEGEHRPAPALVLSLHGASVEASGQAAAYEQKPWAWIVAPTNRRPFGFDWEDWGRLDALEVLDLAADLCGADPSQTYLTGHSMGGHGTWQLGAHFPDRFAAIAPSAGWISFFSYGGLRPFGDQTPVQQAFTRAASPSDTLALLDNYSGLGVYILHGDADDNVPVREAREMRARLGAFHTNFAYYEQPGAGHWWGNQCVDWPPLFHFLRANVRAPQTDRIRFVTASPAISSSYRWATVLEQAEPLRPSRLDLTLDAASGKLVGTTENVARLALDLAAMQRPVTRGEGDQAVETPLPAPGETLTITLDEQAVECTPANAEAPIYLTRLSGAWALDDGPRPERRNPQRGGPFKHAFGRNALLVYGTAGDEAENAWAFAKARFDAETFKYRGNGAFEVVSDRELLDAAPGSPLADPDRNLILYGNAETNAAWSHALAGDGVIRLTRAEVRVGEPQGEAEHEAILAVRPRAGSEVALVGIVGGESLTACRATDRLPYFISGVAYPDFTIFTPDVYVRGLEAVLRAGFFAGDWTSP